jgi:hypothetical protein
MKVIFAALLLTSCVEVATAQEHLPSHGMPVGKLVSENEFVQVFRMSIPAHSRTPMHEVTPRVVVWLSDAHFVDRYADGKTQEETRKAGDAEWVSTRRHAGENLSDKAMEFIAVVLKGAGAGAAHQPDHAGHR